ncbi:MAG: cell division protein FtsQ/DivIB [Thiogranum sp.]|nr:cell division protein FtsQ/DivIB [Thiogranum sp.]
MAVKQAQAKRRQKFRPSWGWVKPGLALLTVAGSAGGLTLMLHWMQDARAWPVRTVQVEGQFRHLEKARLQDEVLPLAQAGFFAVNVSDIQERIEQMPWVDQVSVRRVWPDRLTVKVVEQQPVARWGERGFLNGRAQLFEPQQPVDLTQLPQLAGPAGYEQRVLEMHGRLLNLLQPLRLGVAELQLDARRTWRVQLSNGLAVEIGRYDPLERIERFVRVYPAILAAGKGAIESVDLRYSNGFAVRWQQTDEKTRSTG